MKPLLLFCALTLAACGPHATTTATDTGRRASAAAQEPTMETLRPLGAQDGSLCTRDRVWCTDQKSGSDPVTVAYAGQQVAVFAFPEGRHGGWDRIIRTARADGGEDVLIGVAETTEQMYSGGGGQATLVSLYRLSSGTGVQHPQHPALTFPVSAALDIRACFSEADVRARRDACSDQYNFSGALSLDASVTPARLVLVTEATTYPAHISRSEDNTHPLTQADLKTTRDETCSYRRVFTWDAASQTYKPDAPLPACSDYLEP